MTVKMQNAWCGFSEGKPHCFWQDGERVFAIYKTRDAARRNYQDFRSITIVYNDKTTDARGAEWVKVRIA